MNARARAKEIRDDVRHPFVLHSDLVKLVRETFDFTPQKGGKSCVVTIEARKLKEIQKILRLLS
jgi:hypothetical protein